METQKKHRVAVVILNWNGKHFLEKFLPSVLLYSKHVAEIIVADNASTDNSVSFLNKKFPGVKVIAIPENKGFTGGYNYALAKLEHEFFVLLNSDVEVQQNWIEPILTLFDHYQKIAVCQPKILDYNMPNRFEYAGAAGGFIDKLGYPFCRGRLFDQLEVDDFQYNYPVETFWATGACMFIRSAAFKAIGGFEEEFFAHMEEIDLCWRLRNSGYKVAICPKSQVLHVGGGTLPKNNAQKTYLNFRNNLLMLYRNMSTPDFLRVIFSRLILDGLAGLKFALDGGFKDCYAVIRAHFYFYSNFHRQFKKRKDIQKQVVNYDKQFIYQHNIVSAFYLKGQKKYTDLTDVYVLEHQLCDKAVYS